MSEVFTTSGESSDITAGPSPNLQGLFLPGIDNPQFVDGFGIVTPWGGGRTARRYGDYGISTEISRQSTQLSDLASSLIPAEGGGISFGMEGPQGIQGIPGRDGIDGIIHVMGLNLPQNSNFLTELPHNIDQINDLGTAVNKLVYTEDYNTFVNFTWAECGPGGDDHAVELSYTTADSTKQGAISTLHSWYQSFSPTSTFTLTGLQINIDSIVTLVAKATIYFYNADEDGNPVGQPLGGGYLGDFSTDGTGWQGDLSLSGGITLTSGNRYCFRLQGRGGSTGEYYFDFDSNDGYANGTCWYWNGSDYVAQNGDINFKIYGDTSVGATDKKWRAVASDSDGSHLIAAHYSGSLYTSSDYGVTWVERTPEAGITNYRAVASDSDGSHLIVTGYKTNSKIWTSADSGANWVERKPTADSPVFTGTWYGVASNSDGSKLIAGGSWVQDECYTSSDYGATWVARQPGGIGSGGAGGENASWNAFACGQGGNTIIAAGTLDARGIWTSADSGANWVDKTPSSDVGWDRVASDSDGSHLMAAGKEWGGSDERLFISSNSGASWSRVYPAGGSGGPWDAIAIDSDGSNMIAAEYGGRVYISADSGVSWDESRPVGDSNKAWRAVASNLDGSHLLAGIYDGRLYRGTFVSSYSEATWAESALTSAGRALLDDANVAAQATTLGLGTGDSPTFTGLTLSGIAAEATDVDKFLVDSTGVIKYRTGAQVLSDIGGQPLDTGLTNLAALTYASDSFIKVTATDVYAIRTIAETKTDLSLNNVSNVAIDDTAYNATSWNTNTDGATKNTIRDKIETMDTAIGLNTAKATNVPTALSVGTVTATTYGITSDGGANDIVLPEADTNNAGLLGAAKWDEIVANSVHSALASGNPHSVTPTELGLIIGTNTQAWDAGLDSLAGLGYVSDSMIKITAEDTYAIRTMAQVLSDIGAAASGHNHSGVYEPADAGLTSLAGLTYAAAAFVKMTGTNAFALRTIANVRTDLSISNVEDIAISTWAGSGNITTVGALGSGSIAVGFTSISTDYTDAKCTDATADNTAGNQTSHADVLQDGDFGSNGLMERTGAGSYGIKVIGTDVQAYHANLAAIAAGTWTGAASITTLGTITTVGNITIADGGTIGQAAGPLLTFDDTNDFLEITGCKVGVGTATPTERLHLEGASCSLKIKNTTIASRPAFYLVHTDNDRAGFFYYDKNYSDADLAGNLRIYLDNAGKFIADNASNVCFGVAASTSSLLTLEGTVSLKEQASADGDTATYGQIWVKTATPNTLWFTDDSGVDYAISPKTLTITASADDTNVLGINTMFINPASANVIIGGLTGGIAGQVLCIAITGIAFTTTLENQEGIVGSQDIYLCDESDDTLDDYGGWTLICDGTNWYDCGHAKHV